MSEENLMCPICGGLHPAGHRDTKLEEQLEAVRKWARRMEFRFPFIGNVAHIDRQDMEELEDILRSSTPKASEKDG